MKGFLLKGGINLFVVFLIGMFASASYAQPVNIKFPADLTLTCGADIPAKDPSLVQLPQWGSACPDPNTYNCCSDQPLKSSDGCYVAGDQCFQVALVCVDYDGAGYPIYKFKVYNGCRKDLSNITFTLPNNLAIGGVYVKNGNQFIPVGNGAKVTSCDRQFKVELPNGGPDAGTLKFDGVLPPGKTACFEYKVLSTMPQPKIVVNPKLGPDQLTINILTDNCKQFNGTPIVKIDDEYRGDRCSANGLIILRTYTVLFPLAVPVTHTQKITIPGDVKKPVGSCPAGMSNLTSKTQVPSPYSRIAEVKGRYSDDCDNDLDVTLYDTKEEGGNCGSFKVTHIYAIRDNCQNTAYCEVVYSGGQGGGNITGACPNGNTNLQCFDEVPSIAALKTDLLNRFQGADGKEVTVEIKTEKSTGNDCGFWVKYVAKITDNCGNVKTCDLVYEGKDTKAPTGTCPSGKTDLTSPAQAPDFTSYFQQKWSDNCGKSVVVTKKPDKVEYGDCGSFKVLQWYVIADKCNNSTTCEVVHTGTAGGGNLIGQCPSGATNLQCLDEVPSDDKVIWLVKESFQNEKDVKIWEKWKEGDECGGFKYSFQVMVTGYCGESQTCIVVFKGKDTTAPTLKPGKWCPEGKENLTSPNSAPNPSQYLAAVKDAYQDNCGGAVYAEYLSQEVKNTGECGDFQVIQKFKVYDKCGNATFCYITHKGTGGGGNLIGQCPSGATNLQCLDEVPSDDKVIWLVKESFQNEKDVKIWEKWKEGDECGGFKYSFQVMVTGYCGQSQTCIVVFKGKDTTAPTLKPGKWCPEGKENLTSPNSAPNPSQYLAAVKDAYQDNCGGPVYAEYVSQEVKNTGECGDFQVIQKFKVYDKCGNATFCYITHKGTGGGGNLIGQCPSGATNLQCLDEVPSDDKVIWLVKESFQNEKDVKIWEKWKEGDECGGFKYSFQVMVTGYCGQSQTCIVVFKGKDTTAPTLKPGKWCPEGKDNLTNYNNAPDPSQYVWAVKEAYQDNCGGPVYAEYVSQEIKHTGECGDFQVIQKFKVYDKCGNATFCYVKHSGTAGGGNLIGQCPSGATNLQCLDEVPSDDKVIWLVKESFQNEKEVKIWEKWKEGDECGGFKYSFQVMVTGYCGESQTCIVVFKGKDTTAPTLKPGKWCPEGKDNLTNYNNAPDPSQYVWAVKEAYQDNCGGPVYAEYVSQEIKHTGECGDFQVIQKFKVYDKCGNATFCYVKHSGTAGGGNLIGQCPSGATNLQCLDEVPSVDEVLWLVKESFQNEKEVKLWEKWKEGDECGGFKVSFQVMVTGYCGESETCIVVFKGKDTKAPTGYCPEGLQGLSDISKVPDPTAFQWKIKNAYTDNCGGTVIVTYLGKDVESGSCGSFKVTQKYKVADQCGNATYCSVTHTGTGGGGSITGDCPNSKSNLTCKDEVPSANSVAAQIMQTFKGADGQSVSVALVQQTSEGSNCGGFTVKYWFRIKDNCGNVKECWVSYSGKDKTPPVFTSELEDLVIGCGETPTFETPTATDNCGEATVKKLGDDLIIEGACAESYSIVRTWIALDACGNPSDPISQTITISGDCCQPEICAYTPVYWGEHPGTGTPNLRDILEANEGSITVGGVQLDSACIDVLLPGAPLATAANIAANCDGDLVSTSLLRHTIALTLNTLNQPALCEVLLKDLPCPIDYAFYGFDETSTVCDLLAAANEALENEPVGCELADALAAVNECFGCLCEDEPGNNEEEDFTALKITPPSAAKVNTTQLSVEQSGLTSDQLTMEVFPNPSAGLVNIRYSGFDQARVYIFIHNSAGELVHRTVVQDGNAAQLSLDLAGSLKLSGGAYFITASSGKQTVSKRLIVSYDR